MSEYNYAVQDYDGEVTLRVVKPEFPKSGLRFWSRAGKYSDYLSISKPNIQVSDWKSRVVDLKTHDYKIVDGLLIAVTKEDKDMAHVHAEKMKQYAEDAAKHNKPWELWQFKCDGTSDWWDFIDNPVWDVNTEYERKPVFIEINGHKVPKPLTVAPKHSTYYYTVSFGVGVSYQKFLWTDAKFDKTLLADGLVHDNAEAAELHTKAILSFTKGLS